MREGDTCNLVLNMFPFVGSDERHSTNLATRHC